MKLLAATRLQADTLGKALSWITEVLDQDNPILSINSKGNRCTVYVDAPVKAFDKVKIPQGLTVEPKGNKTLITVNQ